VHAREPCQMPARGGGNAGGSVSTSADIEYPEGFEKWPQHIRDEWWRGFHALYFPWEHLQIPADLRTKAEARARGMGLDVSDGVTLALEEWTAT
jgi:hypothetical protein